MPFCIIRNDITKVTADAIVNTANPQARIGGGTDSAIYQAAGADALLAERRKLGDIPVGQAAATSAFGLRAKYIIHTVGPVWQGGTHGEEAALRSCYEQSLHLAHKLGCESVAFPLISTGVYNFPRDKAMRIATAAIYDFLMEQEMLVELVVFDRSAYELSGRLFPNVQSYIDEQYVSDQTEQEYRRRMWEERRARTAPAPTLSGALHCTQSTFQEYLLELIRQRNLKNSDVYHGANLSKQHFSKMLSNKNYKPTKNTVCALALALHLDRTGADALLAKAGLLLTDNSRFDLAVQYFLDNQMYNIVEDNIALYENGLELLGTQN